MVTRVSSDDPSVETVRATLARVGRTDRRKVTVPDEAADRFPAGEVVGLVVDGTRRHARVERALDDSLELRGAYDTPEMAREERGENRLLAWVEREGLDAGRSVLVDVVSGGDTYGLRAPGDAAVYEVREGPEDSLAAIAEDLEGDR